MGVLILCISHISGILKISPVTIKNRESEPAILYYFPKKLVYPSETTISDPLVYNCNESEPNPLKQPG